MTKRKSPRRSNKGRPPARVARKPRLRNLDAYTDANGVVHPIRGTAGYKPGKALPGGGVFQQYRRPKAKPAKPRPSMLPGWTW